MSRTRLPAISASRCGDQFSICAVGDDAAPVEAPFAVHDRQVTARVHAAEPQDVVLGEHTRDHRVARIAAPDEEPGAGRAARVRPVELTPVRAVGRDPVALVVDRGQQRPPVPVHARPQEPVRHVVARGQVLDRDAIGFDHMDAVRAFKLAVDDRAGAVHAPDRDVGRGHGNGFPIDARIDQHHAPGLRDVYRVLDRGRVAWHPDRLGEPGRHRFSARAGIGGDRGGEVEQDHHRHGGEQRRRGHRAPATGCHRAAP